jgi:hypothetical protein
MLVEGLGERHRMLLGRIGVEEQEQEQAAVAWS